MPLYDPDEKIAAWTQPKLDSFIRSIVELINEEENFLNKGEIISANNLVVAGGIELSSVAIDQINAIVTHPLPLLIDGGSP